MRIIARTLTVITLALSLAVPAWAAPSEGRYDYMKRFTKALDHVRNGYVREVTNEELMDGAMKGMLQALDPHSTYLDKTDFAEMKDVTTGRFSGVGIEISTRNNQLIVVSPIEDTPAYKAGIKAGDVILAVDGQFTQDMSTQEAVSKIRGPENTEVELLIMHADSTVPETVVLKRAAIPYTSVKTRFLDDDGTLWVRLTRFSDRTVEELKDGLKEQSKKSEITGIVLDMRNNPGGLFQQSIKVSDMFLSKGMIVSTRGKGGVIMDAIEAKPSSSDIHCPLVVLINAGSASASEIVAGALQDNNRAVVMGERSFGKGSVQTVIPLGDGTGIKFTIALYYTPNGRSIQAEGIIPDLEVLFEPPREEEVSAFSRFRTREADLSRHLENGSGDQDSKAEKGRDLVEEETAKALAQDNQLRMALQLVRSLPKISEVHSD